MLQVDTCVFWHTLLRRSDHPVYLEAVLSAAGTDVEGASSINASSGGLPASTTAEARIVMFCQVVCCQPQCSKSARASIAYSMQPGNTVLIVSLPAVPGAVPCSESNKSRSCRLDSSCNACMLKGMLLCEQRCFCVTDNVSRVTSIFLPHLLFCLLSSCSVFLQPEPGTHGLQSSRKLYSRSRSSRGG